MYGVRRTTGTCVFVVTITMFGQRRYYTARQQHGSHFHSDSLSLCRECPSIREFSRLKGSPFVRPVNYLFCKSFTILFHTDRMDIRD